MRHPVSSIARSGSGERLRGAMPANVVGSAILPAAPEDASPRAGEDTDCMLMPTAARAGTLIHEGGPARGMPGVVGEGRERPAQAFVAGPAEDHGLVLTGGMRDGRQAALGGELFVTGEARAIVAVLMLVPSSRRLRSCARSVVIDFGQALALLAHDIDHVLNRPDISKDFVGK